ncbi:MAG: choice-of-anchor Q domain-containing protein, partial [Caldilineaceae bacterium]
DVYAVIHESTIAYNRSTKDGGGIGMGGDRGTPSLALVNSTLSGNQANDNGGGLAAEGFVSLHNVTISGNTADADGEGSGDGGGVYGEVSAVENSIIAANFDLSGSPLNSVEPDVSGLFSSSSYNVIGDNTGDNGSFVDGTDGNQVGSSASPLDPLLGPLKDNGGPAIASGAATFTHALQNGSPARNRGMPVDPGSFLFGCADDSTLPLTADQRNVDRPDTIANRCDVGAVEMQATDVGIAKSVTPATVAPGETITYTLVITAGGTIDPALGVVITDAIPMSVTATSVISSGIAFVQTGDLPYTWQVDSVPVGATGYLTITGVVSNATSLLGTTVINTAEISAFNDSYADNNSDSAAFDVVGVTVGVSPASVDEDGAVNLTYTFTRTGPTASPLTVSFDVGGTAAFATDYTQSGAASFGATSGTVTIPASSSTATVVVDPTADTLAEIAETVILTATAGTGYGVGSPSRATGTITDDDSAGVTVSHVNAYEGQSGTTDFVFTVTLTNAVSSEVFVPYGTTDGTALVSDSDYNPDSAGVSFPAGLAGTQTVTITVVGDRYVEADEIFYFDLFGAYGNGQNVFVSDDRGIGTILNDDFADVTVSKAVWPTLLELGDALTYTIHFTNSGSGIATGVYLTDSLPADLTATGVVSSGIPLTQTSTAPYTWQVGELWPNDSGTLTITASLGNSLGLYGTTISNTVYISASNDYTTTNNSSSAAFGVVGAPVLAIHKSVDNASPNESGTITYTVVVSNTGASTATGVDVYDAIAGALASDISLAAGARVTYTYPISQDDGPLTVVNTATVTSSQTSPVSASVTVQWQNVAPTASLGNDGPVNDGQTAVVSFSSQRDPSSADTTSGFHYSYDFDNDGTFEITNTLAATATVPAGYLTGVTSRTVRGRIADKDGGYTDYTTTVTINAPTATPTPSITPTPSQTPTQTPTITPTPSASPSTTPTVTPTPSASPSATSTVTPTPSASPSTTPTVTPTPSASPSPTPTVTPTASASPSTTPTVTPTASASPSATPTVTPTVTPTITPTQTPTDIASVPALALSLMLERTGPAADGIVTVGQEVTFTLRITNTGDSALTTLPLTDTFDSTYLSFLAASPAADSSSGGQLGWNNLASGSPLAVNATQVVTLRYRATASTDLLAAKTTGQTARVDGAQNASGQTAAPAQASAGIRITNPSLVVEKTLAGSNPFAVQGAPITFTIRLTNTGDTSLALVDVHDIHDPTHFVYRTASLPPSQIDNDGLQWSDITTALGDIAPGTGVSFQAGFTVTTTASPVMNRVQINRAVDENGDPVNLASGQAEVDVALAAVDLTLDSEPAPLQSVRPGDCIVYDLMVTNTGGMDLTHTTLTAAPPEGTTVVESCPGDSQARLPGPQAHAPAVVWDLGTLRRGFIETRQLRVTVNGDIQVLAIVLRAAVTSDQTGDFAITGQGTNPLDPTAVTLLRFTARSQPDGVQVNWVTGAEVNAWGFHLWRTASEQWGSGLRVTPGVIPAAGRNGSGASYSFFDPDGKKGHWYWLQEVESDGNLNLYGPVLVDAVTSGLPQRSLFLPMVGR